MSIRNWAMILLLVAPLLSHAAEITKSRPGRILIVGGIVKGDAEKLRQVIRAQNGLGVIELDTPGGDIDEAIRMAEMIKPLFVIKSVISGKFCASACSLIWFAGAPRNATAQESVQRLRSFSAKQGLSEPQGIVGLHRPYLAKFDSVTNSQSELMGHVQNYLEKQSVPRRLIDLMMARPSNDIYWLNAKDFEELGEYRPDVEEFLINKCGYVRITQGAMDRGLTGAQIVAAMTCTNNYLDQVRDKALAGFKK